MATVLALVQSWCRLNGQTVPSALVGSTDAGVLQLLELVNKTGKDIRRRTSWEKTTKRVTWTSTGVEDQGTIVSRCPDGYEYIIPETFWNTTTRIPLTGPLSDKDWQMIKSMVPATPLYQFRIQEGNILVAGPVPATDTLSLMYKTFFWLSTAVNLDPTLADIAADTNVPIFPDELMLLGLDVFWREMKQLDAKSQRTQYEFACTDLGGVDGVKPVIDMAGGRPTVRPGIYVPYGSWNV